MEPEEKVWEILLSADKKDYERICIEYGITNFRGMLKRLSEMRKEKEEEVAEVHLCSQTVPKAKEFTYRVQMCFSASANITENDNYMKCRKHGNEMMNHFMFQP